MNDISFLALSSGAKEKMRADIREYSYADNLFWVELCLAVLIASFGLMQNSIAVVIGAMLIAPLLRPIQTVSFHIATGQSQNLIRSFLFLIKSVFLSVLVSYVFSLVVPLRVETSEILARTQPNLLDLLIAAASGIVAFLSLYYQRLIRSVAGVAMAASLVPPLAVVGIEISLGSWSLVWGSLFLFITNLVAILLVGVLMFFFYGFKPKRSVESKLVTFDNVAVLFILLVLISFPLFSSLHDIALRVNLKHEAKIFLEKTLAQTIPRASLAGLSIKKLSRNQVDFLGTIKVPENVDFYLESQETIRVKLADALKRNVNLSLEIIPVASIVSWTKKANHRKMTYSQKIKERVRRYYSDEFSYASIVDLQVSQLQQEDNRWVIKTVFSLPVGLNFSTDLQLQLEHGISALFLGESFNYLWGYLPQINPFSAVDSVKSGARKHRDDIILKWENYFKSFPPEYISIKNLNITWQLIDKENRGFSVENISKYLVRFDLYVENGKMDFIPEFKRRIREYTKNFLPKKVEIEMRVFGFGQEIILPVEDGL